MQRYFKNRDGIERFLLGIKTLVCPLCGAQETFVRHGFIRGSVSPAEHGIRGWRIYCDPKSPYGRGCGHAPALWLSSTLLWRCFSVDQLQLFLATLLEGCSVYAAWKACFSFASLRTAYRLRKRLQLCQSIWRTNLLSRAPPPEAKKSACPGLQQVFDHLQKTFPVQYVVKAYQECFQHHFLSLA